MAVTEVIQSSRVDRQFFYSHAGLARAVRRLDDIIALQRRADESEKDFIDGACWLCRIRHRVAMLPPGAKGVREIRPVELEWARARTKDWWKEKD